MRDVRWVIFFSLLVSCGRVEGEDRPDTDSDADTDVDSDSDSDTETEEGSDSDTGSETETESTSETGTETENYDCADAYVCVIGCGAAPECIDGCESSLEDSQQALLDVVFACFDAETGVGGGCEAICYSGDFTGCHDCLETECASELSDCGV